MQGSWPSGRCSTVDWRVLVGTSPAYDVPSATLYGEDTDVGLVDAWGRWTLHTPIGPTRAQLGLQNIPFNRERMISSTDLLFQERAVGGEWTAAVRDTGLTVSQSAEIGGGAQPPKLIGHVGVYNGEPGSFLGNPSPGTMQLGRVELEIGDSYRTWDPEGDFAFGLGAAARNEMDPAVDTVTYGADLLLRVWHVALLAEASQQTLSLSDTTLVAPAVLAETTRQSAMAQLSFFVPTHDAQGVEFGAHFAWFDDDVDAVTTGDVTVLHGGATWRDALPGVDLGAGYIHRGEASSVGPWANDTLRIWTQIRPRRASIQ